MIRASQAEHLSVEDEFGIHRGLWLEGCTGHNQLVFAFEDLPRFRVREKGWDDFFRPQFDAQLFILREAIGIFIGDDEAGDANSPLIRRDQFNRDEWLLYFKAGFQIQDHVLWEHVVIEIELMHHFVGRGAIFSGRGYFGKFTVRAADRKGFRIFLAGKPVDPSWLCELWILIPNILTAAPQTDRFGIRDSDHRVDGDRHEDEDRHHPHNGRWIHQYFLEGCFQVVHGITRLSLLWGRPAHTQS